MQHSTLEGLSNILHTGIAYFGGNPAPDQAGENTHIGGGVNTAQVATTLGTASTRTLVRCSIMLIMNEV